ncbi:universal stress protein [Microvirga terrestris]|uniref:Universal stress protein n=1 Tax=Microvirga terrestris TaxID=2791024 RepID=A0ABS0HTX7_9HYPH|nr:universal stress protein [Microvirga terrestris]MBF9196934.1 universal stress protein [Microvirga terrestris]
MLRSIVIALDGSPSSLQAIRLGLELARRHQAHVEGLGIVNSAWIQHPEAVPADGIAYKIVLNPQELQDSAERMKTVLRDFEDKASEAGVASCKARRVEGNPAEAIEIEAASHDLIVLGRGSLVSVAGEISELPWCVEHIVRGEPRPVLLVPDGTASRQSGTQAPVVVGYDGSPASSRVIHMFALLGLAAGRIIHVITLDRSSAVRAEETAARACTLLRRHRAAEAYAVGLGDREAGTPAETILGLTKTLGAGMIVMGAYGHRGIQEIFGSCTREVLHVCPTPLFVHH